VNIAQIIPLADTWMHGGWGWGWMSVMMVVMVLFWGAIIFGAVWLVRGVAGGASAPAEELAPTESPVEILERRFAEGEISEDDYRARRGVLVNEGTAAADGAGRDKLPAAR
jgi:putative membrane protein